MFLLQSVNVNDKVIIIADTRHTQRWSERKTDPTLCKGDLAFFCISPTTLEILRLWAHERTLGVPRNVNDLETIDFAEKLGTIAAYQHLTRCVQACLAGAEVIKLNSTIRERLTKSSETKTWKTEETPWKRLIEKLICLNKHHCLVTRIPERTSSILRSDDYIETCDIYRKKHSCRCHVLPGLHKTVSVPPRLFDVRDATTQSRDLKHTKCHHLDVTRSITQLESMCSR